MNHHKHTVFITYCILLALVLAACSAAETQPSAVETHVPTPSSTNLPVNNDRVYWSPTIGASLQWQLSDYPLNISHEVDIYDVDLFEVPVEIIEQLHKLGKHIICYVNAGAWEDWRPDADQFPQEVIGRSYSGWPGEKWLDIANYELFQHILLARLDLAQEKGCDAIEADNIDGYLQKTGFDISLHQQILFNQWLADEVHQRGMSIGMKNAPELIPHLLEYYDWALLEDCAVYDWCSEFQSFIKAGKTVFQVEYTDSAVDFEHICTQNPDYFKLYKERELDSWVVFCP